MINKQLTEEHVPQRSTSHSSDLPLALLELILKHLPVQDYLMFGVVCRWWRNVEKHRCYSPAPQLPWLMLHQELAPTELSFFFNLSEERIYEMRIPDFHKHACISSCQGWLRTNNQLLVNPFNKKLIKLPKVYVVRNYIRSIFLSTPMDPDGILIVHTKSYSISFVYYVLKNFKVRANRCKTRLLSNFISCKGKPYGLDIEGHLMVIEFLHDHPVDKILEMRKIPWIFSRNNSILLAESSEEILLVRVIGGRWKEWVVERNYFKVHRANLSVMEWEKIENLGDRILFLSKRGSISISASETGGRGNCIYYIPESTQGKWLVFELGSGILEVNSFEDYDGDIEKFWVMPSS